MVESATNGDPGGGGGDDQGGGGQANGGQGGAWGPGGGASFSNAARGGQHTKFIHCYLKKKEEVDTPWQLTLREKAKLIFTTLGLPESSVVGYDESLMKCFRIVVPENFDVDRYLPTTEIEIRKGLSVLPLKEMKVDIQIEVSRTAYDTPDDAIIETLSHFGKVLKIEHKKQVLTEAEAADPILRKLGNIKTGDRLVDMEVLRNIPSFVPIQNKKCRIWYKSQEWSCGNCLKSFKICPEKGDRKECFRKGNQRLTLESVWERVRTDTNRRERMRSDEEHNTDSVQLKNVPHGAVIEDVQRWLMEGGIFVILENIIPDMEEDRWIVENQSKEDLEKILSLTRKEMEVGDRRRRVFISPITQSTPMKEKRAEMKEYQLHQMKNSGTVPPPPVTTENEVPHTTHAQQVMSSTGAIPKIPTSSTGAIPKTSTSTTMSTNANPICSVQSPKPRRIRMPRNRENGEESDPEKKKEERMEEESEGEGKHPENEKEEVKDLENEDPEERMEVPGEPAKDPLEILEADKDTRPVLATPAVSNDSTLTKFPGNGQEPSLSSMMFDISRVNSPPNERNHHSTLLEETSSIGNNMVSFAKNVPSIFNKRWQWARNKILKDQSGDEPRKKDEQDPDVTEDQEENSVCPEHGEVHGDEDEDLLLDDKVGLASDSKELNENEVTNEQLDEQIEEYHANILAKNLSKHDAIVENIVRQNNQLSIILSPASVASQAPSNTNIDESNFLKVPNPTRSSSRTSTRGSRGSSRSGSRGTSRSTSGLSRTDSQKRGFTAEESEEEPTAKKEKMERGRKKKESEEKKSKLSRKKKKEDEKCTCKSHPSFICPVESHRGDFVEAEGRITDCDDDSYTKVNNSSKKKKKKSLDLSREDFLRK